MVVSPTMLATQFGLGDPAEDVVVEGCRFIGENTPTIGVLVGEGSRDVFVSDSFFSGLNLGVLVSGAAAPVEGVVVESCRFNGFFGTSAHISAVGAAGVKSLRVAACEFRGPLMVGKGAGTAISFTGGAGSKTGVTIEGCVFRGVNGILSTDAVLMTVTGCTFDSEDASPDYGILLNGGSNVSITGNVVSAPGSYVNGIMVNDVSNVSVAGNQISNCSSTGILITNPHSAEIVGNTANDCGSDGIMVDGDAEDTGRVTIEANVTKGNGGHGISVGPTATQFNFVVGGNVSTDNDLDGLNLNATNLAVNCNVCCDNVGIDINFTGGVAATQTYVGNVRTDDAAPPPAAAANATCSVPE